jgi:hypothetical protein
MPHIYPTHAHTTFKSHRIAVQLESAQAHRANLSRLFDRRCRINCTDSFLMTDNQPVAFSRAGSNANISRGIPAAAGQMENQQTLCRYVERRLDGGKSREDGALQKVAGAD